jgi:hypothetical protein
MMPGIKEEITSSPVGKLGMCTIIPEDQEHAPTVAPQGEVCPAFAGKYVDHPGDQTHKWEYMAYYTGDSLYAGSDGEEGSMEIITQNASTHHSLPANHNLESGGIQNLRNLPSIVLNRDIFPFNNQMSQALLRYKAEKVYKM